MERIRTRFELGERCPLYNKYKDLFRKESAIVYKEKDIRMGVVPQETSNPELDALMSGSSPHN